jgi:hypothetical protein
METQDFLARQEGRRLTALGAARRLLAEGAEALDPVPMFSPWRFAPDPALGRLVLTRLLAAVPRPAPAQLWTLLAPAEALAALPQGDVEERIHRRRLVELGTGQSAFLPSADAAEASPEDAATRVAWGIDELGFLGAEVERRERAAWRNARFTVEPERDAQVTALWAEWFSGAPWSIRRTWDALFLPVVRGVFRAVLVARRVPKAVRSRSLADLEDAFFFALVGGAEAIPGWVELATRVLEGSAALDVGAAPGGPVDALAGVLGEPAWSQVGRCAVARGHWPGTAELLFSDLPGGSARARALERKGAADPRFLESALDLHVVLRLVETWSRSPATQLVSSWAVITQNRGRARSRLRALAGVDRVRLLDRLLGVSAIHGRTVRALRQYSWVWAWQGFAHDFSFDAGRGLSVPCEAPPAGAEPLGPSDPPRIRTWILLAILKGRLGHLERWTRTGGTGDRDSTWARLLTDELPDSLRDPANEGARASTYHRLRNDLADSLGEHLLALRPVLAAIAALEPARNLRAQFTERVHASWDAAVPFPKSGFPTFVEHARAALAALDARRSDARAQ